MTSLQCQNLPFERKKMVNEEKGLGSCALQEHNHLLPPEENKT